MFVDVEGLTSVYLVGRQHSHTLSSILNIVVHAICLTHLPTGCIQFNQFAQYDASFIDTVLREFHVSRST